LYTDFDVVGARTGVRDPEHVLVGWMRLHSDKDPSSATRLGYFDRLGAQLKTISEIEDAAVNSENSTWLMCSARSSFSTCRRNSVLPTWSLRWQSGCRRIL